MPFIYCQFKPILINYNNSLRRGDRGREGEREWEGERGVKLSENMGGNIITDRESATDYTYTKHIFFFKLKLKMIYYPCTELRTSFKTLKTKARANVSEDGSISRDGLLYCINSLANMSHLVV